MTAIPEIMLNNGRMIPQFGSGQDLEAITSLNRDQRTGPDPDKLDGV